MTAVTCCTLQQKSSKPSDLQFCLDGVIDGFNFGGGRDLTGYADGTENPQGEKAQRMAPPMRFQIYLTGQRKLFLVSADAWRQTRLAKTGLVAARQRPSPTVISFRSTTYPVKIRLE